MFGFTKSLSIKVQVLAAFSLVFVATAGLGLVAEDRLSAVNTEAADVRDNWLPSAGADGFLIEALANYRQRQLRVTTVPADGLDTVVKQLDQAVQAVGKFRQDYEPMIVRGTKDEEFMKTFDEKWPATQAATKSVLELSRKGEIEAANTLLNGAARDSYLAASEAIHNQLDHNVTQGRHAADRGEAVYRMTRTIIWSALGLAALLCCLTGWSIIAGVSRPIGRMTDAMKKLAGHDLAVEIEGRGGKNEIGRMADAVQVFKDNMIEGDRLAAEQAAEQEAKMRRAASVDAMTRAFEEKVGHMVSALSAAATEMEASAGSMTTVAERTNEQSVSVAAASEQTSANVQTVATATEELSSSIQEISRQVATSARVSEQAVKAAQETDATVQTLANGAQKVGDVVKLISDIASQTNLLALNATIEAARAGEAGKGFAVVASEVKGLAQQTAKATEEITQQISGIQEATRQAVEAIRGIGGTITEINEIASAIASAVEEQGAATQEIARNVHQAAQATEVVNSNIVNVRDAASETGAAATQVKGAAGELSQHSAQLKLEVDSFLAEVKAA